MYVHEIPNRNSRPTFLLREGIRKGKEVLNHTLANISHWPMPRIEALKKTLKGEFDGFVAPPVADRTFGVLFVLKEIANKLGIIRALGKDLMAKLVLFLILARVAHQGSRLSAVRWAQNHAVTEILATPEFDENDLYAALDWVAERQEAIEKKLYRSYVKRVGAPPALVLYDVSSSYLEGQENELGEFGYNRDGKKGKKQIVYGLLTADDGEPLAVKVFKGNTSDVTTLPDQIETVKNRFGVDEVVFVGDRGMIKTKGKEKLNDVNFRYISALTDPQVRTLLKEQVIQIGLFDENVAEVQHDPERLILRKNPAVAAKQAACKQDKVETLQRLVNERNAFVAQSKRAKPEAGLNRFNRWIKRYKIGSFASVKLNDRQLELTIDEDALEQASMLDGCYVLVTDVPAQKMDKEKVDARYRDLQKVEHHFRMMKTYLLEVRPIYVRKKNRTQAHVFVAMLALKVAREMDMRLKASFCVPGPEKQIMTIEDALDTLSRLCFQKLQVFDQDILTLPLPDEKQIAIFNALDIKPPRVNQISA